MSATFRTVLEYIEDRERVTALDVADKFSISLRAAARHLERLWNGGLIRASEATATMPRVQLRWTITDNGRRRLAYYRGETAPTGTIAEWK